LCSPSADSVLRALVCIPITFSLGDRF
jgi:hypothetical protein